MKFYSLLLIIFCALIFSCNGGGGGGGSGNGGSGNDSSLKEITGFSFLMTANPGLSADIHGVISGSNITLTAPHGTSISDLVATFNTNGASVKIGATVQVCGVTANDFTNPVTYTVTAGDGSTQDYVVSLSVAALSQYSVSHLAGPLGGPGNMDGIGVAARFYHPVDIACDGLHLYVSDQDNHIIRKIVLATGSVSTLAGSAGQYGAVDGTGSDARFYNPHGLVCDGANLYVADDSNQTIRKIVIATGVVTTLAGSAGNSGSADGTGSDARFYNPTGIARVGENLYIADRFNSTIRKIELASGAVTTIAGSASQPAGSADGMGSDARFNYPTDITSDGTNLYVIDTGNHTVRKIVIATGMVTTIAGSAGHSGTSDGIGSAARFGGAHDITCDSTHLYVVDDCVIRMIDIASAEVTTMAGTLGGYGSLDGIGTNALFYNPCGITNDGDNLYLCDFSNNTIRKIEISSQEVSTFAGTAGCSGIVDGTGTTARFDYPRGLVGDTENLYVADSFNHTIRKVVIATGVVSTLAGTAMHNGSTDGIGAAARFYCPRGIASDGSNLYVTDESNNTIRKIVIATGTVSTIAGSAGLSGSFDGTGSNARFNDPCGITCAGDNLYVTDRLNQTIRRISLATGAVTTLAGFAGDLGFIDGIGTVARFHSPEGITTDGANLYVVDRQNNAVRKIVIASGVVSTIAGGSPSCGSADGIGAAARFNYPQDITNDGTNLYVADTWNHTIRKIVIASGEVSTIAGGVGKRGSADGKGADAAFNRPSGMMCDGTDLYVADSDNNAIRKINLLP